MAEKEKTVLEQAVFEADQIMEAAIKVAKDRFAKDKAKEFNTYLKEEVNKIKNNKESVQESIVDKNKEPIKKGKSKNADNIKEPTEVNKDSVNESVDLRESSFDEIEEAFTDASPESDFSVDDDPMIDMNDIEEELRRMEEMSNELDIQTEAAQDESDPFTKMKELYGQMSEVMNQMEQQKMQTEMEHQFENYMVESFGKDYRKKLDKGVIKSLMEMYNSKTKSSINESKEHEEEEKEEKVEEMHKPGSKSTTSKTESGHAPLTPQKIDEEEDDESTEEEKDEKRDDGGDVDENLVNTNAAQRKVQGGHSPNIDTAGKHRDGRTRPANRSGSANESYKKRLDSLIAENKKLTKKVNENNSTVKDLREFVEKAKQVLPKYRKQLEEMAVFNSNLSHVNSILLEEDIALTIDDKKRIIKEFKTIGSIDESEAKYKSLINEFKEGGKSTISESIEDRVNDSIGQSSSQTIVEQVNEKTAFTAADKHLQKIKNMMNYQHKK